MCPLFDMLHTEISLAATYRQRSVCSFWPNAHPRRTCSTTQSSTGSAGWRCGFSHGGAGYQTSLDTAMSALRHLFCSPGRFGAAPPNRALWSMAQSFGLHQSHAPGLHAKRSLFLQSKPNFDQYSTCMSILQAVGASGTTSRSWSLPALAIWCRRHPCIHGPVPIRHGLTHHFHFTATTICSIVDRSPTGWSIQIRLLDLWRRSSSCCPVWTH